MRVLAVRSGEIRLHYRTYNLLPGFSLLLALSLLVGFGLLIGFGFQRIYNRLTGGLHRLLYVIGFSATFTQALAEVVEIGVNLLKKALRFQVRQPNEFFTTLIVQSSL